MHPIDPSVFSENAISAETNTINRTIIDSLSALPDQWSFPLSQLRAERARGLGPFPLPPKSPRAVNELIDAPIGKVNIRIIAPENPTGVYLHIHGGGWVLGAADQHDARMEQLVQQCGFATVSVDYRLAPEHPHPAGPDDCEAAALWLIENAKTRFGSKRLLIGGESAGAHLAVVTLLRLRNKHSLFPFCGANLVCGCYDLALTPSVRKWGEEKLILNTRDLEIFVDHFVPDSFSLADPDISPLHAGLDNLPPALFTIGTKDPLLDDSLFMAGRWSAASNTAKLAIYPGGAHVFIAFAGQLAEEGNARIEAFLREC
jgi:acetyl esterase/lipase